jgi:pilus assembly protein Flp/PilA
MWKVLRRAKQRGQGMTEYIIIVALVAIGAIAVVSIFGNNIRALFGSSANALSGESRQLEGDDVSEDDVKKGLRDFGEDLEVE